MGMLITGTLMTGGIASASEDDKFSFNLDQIVVTANRVEQKNFESKANIGVITKKEIEIRHYQNVKEAIRDIPGVVILDYGRPGYDSSNSVRLNGSDKVVVLVDGIRESQANVNPLATTDFISIDNIERIEVLKGAASALYGADAKGGVINIITKVPNKQQTKLSAAVGNFGYEQYRLSNEGSDGKWSYRVLAEKDNLGNAKDGKGNTITRDLKATTLAFQLRNKISDKSDLSLAYNSYKSDFVYDDKFYDGNITSGYRNNTEWTLNFTHDFDNDTHNLLSIKRLEFDSDYSNDSYKQISNNVKSLNVTDQFTKKLSDKHILSSGVTYQTDDIDYRNVYYSGTPSIIQETITSKAIYLQDEWNIMKDWNFTTGLRYDNHSIAGSAFTPRFNLGYKVNDDTNYYVSYNKFFVAPGVSNYYHAKYGNPDLLPEKGYTYEFGYNHRFNDTTIFNAHIFKRHSSNSIGYWSGKYQNIGEEATKGFDATITKQFNKNFKANLGYTYLFTKETTISSTSESINANGYLPRHAINLGLGYSVLKVSLDLQTRIAIDREGKYDGFFPANNYCVMDFAFNYKPTKTITTYFKVNNLLDKFYAEHSGASTTNPENWYAMQGRNFQVGVEYSF